MGVDRGGDVVGGDGVSVIEGAGGVVAFVRGNEYIGRINSKSDEPKYGCYVAYFRRG